MQLCITVYKKLANKMINCLKKKKKKCLGQLSPACIEYRFITKQLTTLIGTQVLYVTLALVHDTACNPIITLLIALKWCFLYQADNCRNYNYVTQFKKISRGCKNIEEQGKSTTWHLAINIICIHTATVSDSASRVVGFMLTDRRKAEKRSKNEVTDKCYNRNAGYRKKSQIVTSSIQTKFDRIILKESEFSANITDCKHLEELRFTESFRILVLHNTKQHKHCQREVTAENRPKSKGEKTSPKQCF